MRFSNYRDAAIYEYCSALDLMVVKLGVSARREDLKGRLSFPTRSFNFFSASNDDSKGVHEFTPMIEALLQLYAPSDVEKAFLLFGATCGPCAFAAFLRKEVLEVRHYFPSFPERQYTNLPMMTKALASAGMRWERVTQWPNQGLVLISGPEKYHSRHWVATVGEFVYEVSLDTWLPKRLWERDYLPELAKRHQSKACDWHVEAGLELSPFSQLDLPLLCR